MRLKILIWASSLFKNKIEVLYLLHIYVVDKLVSTDNANWIFDEILFTVYFNF